MKTDLSDLAYGTPFYAERMSKLTTSTAEEVATPVAPSTPRGVKRKREITTISPSDTLLVPPTELAAGLPGTQSGIVSSSSN